MRLIVSSMRSLQPQVAKYLAEQLQPHIEGVESHVKNRIKYIKLMNEKEVQFT